MNRSEQQVLALAGMFQAAVVVDELAFSGKLDNQAFEASLNSLFTFDAHSAQEIFGGLDSLQRGFRALEDYLGGELRGSSRNIAHYVLSMMKLAPRLTADEALADQLLQRLRSIERHGNEFEMSQSAVVLKIGGLYQDSISRLNPRIMVAGEANFLQNAENAARVRTLLLAGIRAAVLWRQLGGSKWKLLLGRKKYVTLAREMASRCHDIS